MNKSKFRTYDMNNVAAFKKTSELFGGLSNMAGGYPIVVNDINILSSEALYQACRYPDFPEIQSSIIRQRSPMAANMVSKQEVDKTRPDWLSVRVPIMKWCLKVKLAQNWDMFSELLESTGNLPIVEVSNIDEYWACKIKEGKYIGGNVLGRLLMELRDFRKTIQEEELNGISPLQIVNFKFLGEDMGFVPRKNSNFQQKVLF